MSQKNNKSRYEIFSSVKADAERSIEGIESKLQPTILVGMASRGLASGTMDVKETFELRPVAFNHVEQY